MSMTKTLDELKQDVAAYTDQLVDNPETTPMNFGAYVNGYSALRRVVEHDEIPHKILPDADWVVSIRTSDTAEVIDQIASNPQMEAYLFHHGVFLDSDVRPNGVTAMKIQHTQDPPEDSFGAKLLAIKEAFLASREQNAAGNADISHKTLAELKEDISAHLETLRGQKQTFTHVNFGAYMNAFLQCAYVLEDGQAPRNNVPDKDWVVSFELNVPHQFVNRIAVHPPMQAYLAHHGVFMESEVVGEMAVTKLQHTYNPPEGSFGARLRDVRDEHVRMSKADDFSM